MAAVSSEELLETSSRFFSGNDFPAGSIRTLNSGLWRDSRETLVRTEGGCERDGD